MDPDDFAYAYGSSGDSYSYDPYAGDSYYQPNVGVTYDPYAGDSYYQQPSGGDEYDPYGGDTSGNAENIKPGMGTGGAPTGGLSGLGAGAKDLLKSLFVGSDGKPNPMGILGIGALMAMLGKGTANTPKVGYQGGIPSYTAVRQQVPYAADTTRRPGAGGRKYFTDIEYVGKAPADIQAAKDRAAAQAQELVKGPVKTAAQGGLMNLASGKYLNGKTDGMADQIPANIEGKQEARLSHGEFVIPADVVSHLGNGNSDAGAQRLYDMMEKIRKARTGNPKQGKQINPDKYMPK